MSTNPYTWTDFEPDEFDNIPDKHYITILDEVGEEFAIIVHRTCGGDYPLDGAVAEVKRGRAQMLVDALNATLSDDVPVSQSESYWIAGYTVRGGNDIMVDQYCRSVAEAQKKAISATGTAIVALKKAGFAGEVAAWIQGWTMSHTKRFTQRTVVDTRKAERLTEPINLTREEERDA